MSLERHRWSQPQSKVVTGLILFTLLVGVFLRIYGLDRYQLNHPEFWVPGLEVPKWVRDPPPRNSILEINASTLSLDVHPPGYHFLMLAWNSLCGTGLFEMRLSSACAAILSLFAIYLYARSTTSAGVGIAATSLFALHGYHIMWSQQLRPWALVTLLYLVCGYLAWRLLHKPDRLCAAVYALLLATGLWAEYAFWPLFATHLLWAVLVNMRRARSLLILEAQVIAFVIAIPVLLFIYVHLGRPSHLGSDFLPFLMSVLGFGSVLRRRGLTEYFPTLEPVLTPLVAVVGAAAIAYGIWASRRLNGGREAVNSEERFPAWAFFAAALVSSVVVVSASRFGM